MFIKLLIPHIHNPNIILALVLKLNEIYYWDLDKISIKVDHLRRL